MLSTGLGTTFGIPITIGVFSDLIHCLSIAQRLGHQFSQPDYGETMLVIFGLYLLSLYRGM